MYYTRGRVTVRKRRRYRKTRRERVHVRVVEGKTTTLWSVLGWNLENGNTKRFLREMVNSRTNRRRSRVKSSVVVFLRKGPVT